MLFTDHILLHLKVAKGFAARTEPHPMRTPVATISPPPSTTLAAAELEVFPLRMEESVRRVLDQYLFRTTASHCCDQTGPEGQSVSCDNVKAKSRRSRDDFAGLPFPRSSVSTLGTATQPGYAREGRPLRHLRRGSLVVKQTKNDVSACFEQYVPRRILNRRKWLLRNAVSPLIAARGEDCFAVRWAVLREAGAQSLSVTGAQVDKMPSP
jgi:hypothetical protein